MAVINILAPKLPDEFIRTDYEKLFQIGLDSLNIKYRIGIIYCFECCKTFTWGRSELPERCFIGQHKWDGPGAFARPDFLLYGNDIDDIIAVIRIDGPVHDGKKQKTKDKFQTRSFLNIGVKVFIIRNEHLLGAQHSINKKRKSTWFPVRFPDWHYSALALLITMAAHNDKIYQTYIKDKDVKFYLGI